MTNPTTEEPVEKIVVVVEEPEAKKQKTVTEEEVEEVVEEEKTTITMTETKTTTPESPDEEWPEAWYMLPDGEYDDQKAENRMAVNKPCSVAELKKLGIAYWKMDAETYKYPVKAIPWDPKDAADPKLMAIRDDRKFKLDFCRVVSCRVVSFFVCVCAVFIKY
jgi:hypothetical protein